jgi:hypothetical protein
MRETALSLRERTFRGWAAAPEPAFLRRHRITFAIAAAGAVLMAGVGAFGTGSAAPAILYAYWFTVMLGGALVGAWALDAFGAVAAERSHLGARAGATIMAVALLVTPLVWVVAGLILHGSWAPAKMLRLFPQAALVSAAFVAVQIALERRSRLASPPSKSPVAGPPPLLMRLPEKLRDARIEAVEAEDHYLRVHTDAGSALILMRLSDAVEELAGLAGARTHRSWWVARDAVRAAERGGGRATLRLASGVRVPVSRSYARDLRREGWF